MTVLEAKSADRLDLPAEATEESSRMPHGLRRAAPIGATTRICPFIAG